MKEWLDKINNLDLGLFASIPSQTSDGDRRSMLAVQRATARRHKEYVYLEIGSHLGGSIQPYLVDDRCKRIYSIDARPLQQPDDRSPGYVAYYEDNSTERMLSILVGIGCGDVSKIKCFDLDASKVDLRQIVIRPHVVLIDGEHTKDSVISDFQFCSRVVNREGTILFHDFSIIYPTILKICKQLDKQNLTYLPLKLEDEIFAIFFDTDMVNKDQYLISQYKINKNFLLGFRIKTWLKTSLPLPLLRSVKYVRKAFKKIYEVGMS
jgi:hypothetical protein